MTEMLAEQSTVLNVQGKRSRVKTQTNAVLHLNVVTLNVTCQLEV